MIIPKLNHRQRNVVINVISGCLAFLVALGFYVLIVNSFRYSGIAFFENLAVWISPIIIFGWIFFGILWFIIYTLLGKYVLSPPPSS